MPRLRQKKLPATFNARKGGAAIVNLSRDRRRVAVGVMGADGTTAHIELSTNEARKVVAQLNRTVELAVQGMDV